MSALTTRDALAKALHDSTVPVCPHWATGSVCERQADALLASGAVIDASALADDEARVKRAADVIQNAYAAYDMRETFEAIARNALAAALSERDA